MPPLKIFWCDMETGGLDPREQDATEISGIVDIDGTVMEEFELLVAPSYRQRVTDKALQIQGRTVDEVMAHPLSQRDAWQALKNICGRYVDPYDRTDKFFWAGQNPGFDMNFGRALWVKNGDNFFQTWWHAAPIDLMAAVAIFRTRGYLSRIPDHKLGTICNALHVPLEGAHKALNDIRATRQAFYKMAERIPRYEVAA